MSVSIEETNETQHLMQNHGDDDDQKTPQLATSPGTSNKSGAASFTSRNQAPTVYSTGTNSNNESAKLSFVNERRLNRDAPRANYSTKTNKHTPKEAPDVKHMEKALLDLLDDFHSGKLSAFSKGCSMEQMIDIRDQQEHLARLHFRLCGDAEKPTDDSFDNASGDKMAQLIQSLEQLSTSIEHLHSDDNIQPNNDT